MMTELFYLFPQTYIFKGMHGICSKAYPCAYSFQLRSRFV